MHHDVASQGARHADLAEEVVLITPVHAIVLAVAHPGRHDAPLVVTLKPVRRLQTNIQWVSIGNHFTNLAIPLI